MSISTHVQFHALVPACLLVLGACDAQVGPDYLGERLASIDGFVDGSGPTESDVMVLWYTATPGGRCTFPFGPCGGGVGVLPGTEECISACDPELLSCRVEYLDAWEACVEACHPDVWAEVYSVWRSCTSAAQGDEVPVKGVFPTRFTLELYDRPPQEALIFPEEGGPGVALGMIAATEAGAPPLTADLRELQQSDQILGLSPKHLLMYTAEPLTEATGSWWPDFLGEEFEPGFHLIEVIDGGIKPDVMIPAAEGLDTEISIEMGPAEELDWPSF